METGFHLQLDDGPCFNYHSEFDASPSDSVSERDKPKSRSIELQTTFSVQQKLNKDTAITNLSVPPTKCHYGFDFKHNKKLSATQYSEANFVKR